MPQCLHQDGYEVWKLIFSRIADDEVAVHPVGKYRYSIDWKRAGDGGDHSNDPETFGSQGDVARLRSDSS